MMLRVIVSLVFLLLVVRGAIAQDNTQCRAMTSMDNLSSEEHALLDEAIRLLDNGETNSGRFLLSSIIQGYGKSKGVRTARWALADSFYNEGGWESLGQAEVLYSQLLSTDQNQENADQILYRLARTQMRRWSDRDSSNLHRPEKTLLTLLERYPESTLRPQTEELLFKMQETLGDQDLGVAKFYFTNRGAMAGAEDRLKEILEKYEHYSKMDEVLWLLGKVESANQDSEQSGIYLRLLIERYPKSKLVTDACNQLGSYGEILPDICR